MGAIATAVRGGIAYLAGHGRTARSFDINNVRSAYNRNRATLDRVAREYGIRPEFFKAVAWHESQFNERAVNPSSGAAGLFQIMPFHWEQSGGMLHGVWTGSTWSNPEANARAGARILLASGYGKNSIRTVLARYGGFSTWLKNPAAATGSKNAEPYIADITGRATTLYLLGDS